jgi:hypothetical protein
MKQLKKYRVNIRITEAEWKELHQQKDSSITDYIKKGKLKCAVIVKENLFLNSRMKGNTCSAEGQQE